MSGSGRIERFEDLAAWQAAHRWVLDVYRLSRSFPADEKFGLTSQVRRAAVSVPGNIAEGFKKLGQADKVRFYNIAQGSLEEARYDLILAGDLDYADTTGACTDAERMAQLLGGLIRSIRAR